MSHSPDYGWRGHHPTSTMTDLQWVRHLLQFPIVTWHHPPLNHDEVWRSHPQDLAFYDLGSPQVLVAAGGGVNERVQDWIVDVERQFAEHLASVDLRLHSSKNTEVCSR